MASTKKADHARRLNGLPFPPLHERWSAEVLGMQTRRNGIDLVDSSRNLGVEIKFMLNEGSSSAWTVQNHQLDYNSNGRRCYWGLGVYDLDRPVATIRTQDLDEIETMILHRELYIVRWGWMSQFKIGYSNGSSDNGSWNNQFRYGARNKVPHIKRTYRVNKGKVHLTSRVPIELFEPGILGKVPF